MVRDHKAGPLEAGQRRMGFAIPSHDAPPENQVRGRLFAGANGSRIPRAKIALASAKVFADPKSARARLTGIDVFCRKRRDGEILKRQDRMN